jgi:Integrase core domain
LPQGPNQRWSLDFVSDALSWGRKFRVLAIVDDFTREALALTVDTSLGGQRVVRELDALIAARGRPLTIVSDNGTELTSRAVLEWTNKTRLERRRPINIPLACWYETCNYPFLVKPLATSNTCWALTVWRPPIKMEAERWPFSEAAIA